MMKKPFATTLDPASSLSNETGSWRTLRPVNVFKLPPCNKQCPAGENIQQWLYYASEGDYEHAWRVLVEDNPLPACMGRVCYHTCEGKCNRGFLDETVGINSVERFLGDYALSHNLAFKKPARETGKRVLVIGSGPAGLSAAYHLRRFGHTVHIMEMAKKAGGMMRYGIPVYRLPRDILDAEVQRILDMGVTIEYEKKVTDVLAEKANGKYDAVVMGMGASLSTNVDIPSGDTTHIMTALDVLEKVSSEGDIQIGRKVAVYGGGNTAVDVARSLRRLGAEPIIVYRRNRDKMPANEEEMDGAIEEGINVKWLSTIDSASKEGLKIEKMKLDENGYPQPSGEYEELAADSVVLAIGQNVDLSILKNVPGLELQKDAVTVDNNTFMTTYEGLFAAGDMVPGDRTVTAAIGMGKHAARGINGWLNGRAYTRPEKHADARFEDMHPYYYTDAPKKVRPQLELARRTSTFDEVQHGLTEENAVFEARRCLSCGNCMECDNCYGVCPDNAIIKLGPGKHYEFNYDYCKGCGVCAQECPCGHIDMVPEKI
ncbi:MULTISPECIES: NAD(P)-binding protein [unclassified Anaerobiospirillum]|uniref:NAD(P)-binding protein n=1 Tax=unclassified Anaerobiospirillum TaxID=2647410 RepID=UPI001FF3A05E|nr:MULTISPECIES: NAD(P)-binding protein [unclassified Anaerobiospirillum]MCK0527655.1 NAD(P)-binding protein [Anaerobiospirillum sp. NML120449]MCK0534849.1 NAD(P)-binding protein [Anaerobiospirillum sp. NML120511]MCK0540131.1 NAD(P)-binding protein [Anaerobiospirillum sp. NML02-A-032]